MTDVLKGIDPRPMTPAELIAAGEAVFGSRWIRPLARAIGWSPRSLRFWMKGKHSIPLAAREKIRALSQIGPVGTIVRRAVRDVIPEAAPGAAHRVAQQALADLVKAGLLDEQR